MNYDAIKRNVQNAYNSYVNNRMDPFEHLFIVGDRMQYERGTPAAQWIIQCPAGETIWGGPQHADYYYALLEGDNNDIHPDVSFSRMPAGSEGVLNLMFGRTLAYEAAPRMQNPEWYGRGAVYSAHWGNDAQGAWHITIHTNVRWGVEVLKKLGFNTVNFFEVYDYDREGNQVGNFMRERYNEGFNIGIGRAEIYYWQSSFQGVNNNTVFPIDICYSGHGEWALECIFRTGDANNMKGPVARTCGWGWPSTAPMSYVWLAMVNGHLQRDWPLGWARMFSLNHIETIFPNFQAGGVNQRPLYQHIKTDTDMWGDPGVQPWIGTPRLASALFPRQIAPGTKLLETRVTVPNNPTPVQGAQVTLYAPGPMPAQNQGLQYAAYNRMWMKTTKTDADGYARFVLTNRDTLHLNTQIFLTVSGRDIRPLFDTATVAVPPVSITVGSHSFEQQSGNDDDALNPGEFFRISLMARNNGNQQTVENLEANIRSLSPYIEIIDNNNIWFGDVAAGRTVEGSNGVDFGIAAICPDAASRPSTKPALEIDFFSGDVHWISAVPLNITAPNWELARIVGGSEIPDSLFDMNLEFKNIGACTAPPASIVLRSLGMGATVIGEGSSLPRIDPNAVQRIERPFSVAGNRVVVPGSITKLLAVISTREGFVDSAEFEVKIRRPRANAPQGPDAGGYICFDNTDTLWDIAPQYEWVEICPQVQDRNFTGARIPFEGRSAFDIGEARVIALGCSTQFYGKLYDSITVATNGFICMGSQRMITNFQNWPMDHAIGGGVGMLAPFWDDLRLGDGSGVFYHHDTLENRVIVQWHRMRLGANQNAPEVTFEVILLDRRWWMTNETGNQNIIFQYRQIAIGENIRGGDQPWDDDIPYASVGISSPDGRTGLNYYFNNVYNVSSAPLSNRRALLFTTSPRFRAGALYGWVIDFGTGLPVEGATIYTKHGFIAFTDQDGYWRIAESLAEIPFDITCHKQGYNDSTYTDLIVDEQDSLNINFDLLHPEFIPSSFQLNEWLDPGLESQIPFYIFNGGNGPLYWSAEKRLLGDANAAPWELRRSYWVGDTLDDDRLEGVVFDGEYFYLSGAAGNNPNLIYVVDRDGNRVRDFVQPGESVYGMKDLEWDGELLWGSGEQRVFGFDRDGNVAAEFNGPTNPNQAIAYDPDNGILWICALTNNISAYDRQGNGLNRTLNRRGLRIYGLAYWADDPDGYPLYILNSPAQNILCVHKMNVVNGDTLLVHQLPTRGSPGGAYITNTFDVYSWVLISTCNVPPQEGGDRIDIFQIEARRDWLDLDVWSGTLNPQEVQDFTLTLNSTGLPDTLFQGELRFHHNADSSVGHIYVNLDVVGVMDPFPFDLVHPANGDAITALPLHGDTLNVPAIRFIWRKARDPNRADSLLTYRLNINVLERAWTTTIERDTFFVVNLDTLGLPLWFDRPVNWSASVRSGENGAGGSANCVMPFSFWIAQNALDKDRQPAAREFALKSAYPNPFNMQTVVRYALDRDGCARLAAFDIAGREVMQLMQGDAQAGPHSLIWNAESLPTGVYLLRLESAGRTKTMKAAIIK